MMIYWAFFLLPLMFGIGPWKAKRDLVALQWFFYSISLFILIGLRYKVGGDWEAYIVNYPFTILLNLPFSDFLKLSLKHDPGFLVFHYVSINYLGNFYLSNIICAAIFVAGLVRLARSTAMPWFALIISIPYLVIVVAMGYTRQAAVIGFLMWALVGLRQGKEFQFYICIFMGVLFHKTAIILFFLGYFYFFKFSFTYLTKGIIVILLVVICYSFLEFSIKYYFYYFIVNPYYESYGATIRVLMNCFSAFVFLIFYRKWKDKYTDSRLMIMFSIVSFLLLPLAFSYSTLADRLALYFLPMQMMILANIPPLIDRFNRTFFVLFVTFMYISVMFVWLNFSRHASYWIPYNNLLTRTEQQIAHDSYLQLQKHVFNPFEVTK